MTTSWEVRQLQRVNCRTLALRISTIGLALCHLLVRRVHLRSHQEAVVTICIDPRPRSREGRMTSTNLPRLEPLSIRASMHSLRQLSVNLSLILRSTRRTTQQMRLAHPPATPLKHQVQVSTNTIPPRTATRMSLCQEIPTEVVLLTMAKGATIAWSLREEVPNPLSTTKAPLRRRWVRVSQGLQRPHKPTPHTTTLDSSVALRTTATT